LSAAKKAEQNKAKTLASMGLKTHFARVAINPFLRTAKKAEQNKAKIHFSNSVIKTPFRLSSHLKCA
jgi:phosphomannomutase